MVLTALGCIFKPKHHSCYDLSISRLKLKDKIIEAYAEWGEGRSELHMNLDRNPPSTYKHTHTHTHNFTLMYDFVYCYEVFNCISLCHHIEKDEKCWSNAYFFCNFRESSGNPKCNIYVAV
jgi:hypothetical protein